MDHRSNITTFLILRKKENLNDFIHTTGSPAQNVCGQMLTGINGVLSQFMLFPIFELDTTQDVFRFSITWPKKSSKLDKIWVMYQQLLGCPTRRASWTDNRNTNLFNFPRGRGGRIMDLVQIPWGDRYQFTLVWLECTF